MTSPNSDAQYFDRKSRQIRSHVSTVLKKWGLLPRFKRWRLTQDPETGMIVLFGILNNRYIAMHTSTPFGNYFDPHLLRDLAVELQIQVVSCNSDGLRYAFILNRGQIDVLPTHIDYPYMDGERLFVRVAYENNPPVAVMEPPGAAMPADDQALVQRGVGAFLKVFDDIKLMEDAAARLAAQSVPDILVINQDEFGRRLAELERNRLEYAIAAATNSGG